MNSFLISLALNTAISFVNEAIKNPSSPKAESLKFRLIELRDALNALIQSKWPNG